MVQVKVKRFSRSKTEIQPEIQPEVLPVNEENEEDVNEEIKENEEDVNEAPIFNELDDLTNINFNKKKNIEAEEILKKVINKKKKFLLNQIQEKDFKPKLLIEEKNNHKKIKLI